MPSPNEAENEYFVFNPFIGNFHNATSGGIAPSSGQIMYSPAYDENHVNCESKDWVPLSMPTPNNNVYAELEWQYLYCNTNMNAVNNFIVTGNTIYLYLTTYNDGVRFVSSLQAPSESEYLARVRLDKTESGIYYPYWSTMNEWVFIFQNNTTKEFTYLWGTYFQPEWEQADFDIFVGAYKIGQLKGSAWNPAMSNAYNNGYSTGKADGIAEANGTLNGFEVIGQAFTGVSSFMSTELLPGISFGTLISVPIMVTLIAVIIRILKK